MEPEGMITWVIERLLSLTEPFAKLSMQKLELKDEGLKAISEAITATFLYYRSIEQGKGRDPNIEAQLSRLWASAAIPIRHVDKELSLSCANKSMYWVNPDTWDKANSEKLGIGLEEINSKYLALLKPPSKRAPKSARQLS
jgi:hypothetical protein